jgi:hypothetical protein
MTQQLKDKQERQIQKQLQRLSIEKNRPLDVTDDFNDAISNNTMLSKKTNSVYRAPARKYQ